MSGYVTTRVIGTNTGKQITITSNVDKRLTMKFFHLEDFSVAKGSLVKAGDVIGKVGSTGRSSGQHLHYEVLFNGKYLNPMQYLGREAFALTVNEMRSQTIFAGLPISGEVYDFYRVS